MASFQPEPKKICLSLAESTVSEALALAQRFEAQADVIEVRLDLLDKPVVAPFIDRLSTPLLFTNRPQWEGGNWQGSEAERIDLLVEAVEHNAAYVDIELMAPAAARERVLAAAAAATTRVIASWHNFKETPADQVLADIFRQQLHSGADIGKIVTMAHHYTDSLRVLALQLLAAHEQFPLAAFCMGQTGKISRAATLELGGVLTYGAADRARCTAPGQLSIDELRTIQELIR